MTQTDDFRRWLMPIMGIAVVLAIVLAFQGQFQARAFGRELPLSRMLLLTVPYWIPWTAAAPLVLWSSERIRAAYPGQTAVQVVLHAAIAIAIMLAHSALLYYSQLRFDVTDLRMSIWTGTLAV